MSVRLFHYLIPASEQEALPDMRSICIITASDDKEKERQTVERQYDPTTIRSIYPMPSSSTTDLDSRLPGRNVHFIGKPFPSRPGHISAHLPGSVMTPYRDPFRDFIWLYSFCRRCSFPLCSGIFTFNYHLCRRLRGGGENGRGKFVFLPSWFGLSLTVPVQKPNGRAATPMRISINFPSCCVHIKY
ncbi:hypothetical protein WA026_003884 [Henosepilachna vigintioctopunctata]|uniref:Uncharacterized protein n=1 Tax=Henosepilachna vigintioctopunctata TaxID=420089 RepID=A0AAW1U936_9CUCU